MSPIDRDLVRDPGRLSAVRASGLLDSAPEESFDRLTRLAARLTRAPVATVTLVDESRDFYKSQLGLAEPAATTRQATGTTLCQLALSDSPLVTSDIRNDPRCCDLDSVRAQGDGAYAGIALRTTDGTAIGSFCVVDVQPREWTDEEIEVLGELAASAEREIRLRGMLRGAESQVAEMAELNGALADSEQRFRALAESDPDGIVTIDERSTILYANAAMAGIFGYREEELVGSSLAMLMPERFRQSHAAGTKRYVSTGTRNIPWQGVQLVGLRSDGTEIPVEISFGEYSASGRRVFAGFISDITERKRVEEALRLAKEEAERASEAKSEFLSRMSHELRTPLNSILGFGQLLARADLAPEHARGVEHILKGGRHLLNLINEVLEISRIEANLQQFSLEPVQARSVIDESLALVRPTAQQQNIRLDFPDPAPAMACVRADQQRLMQVMLNLLSNAIKYNRPRGTVELLVRREGDPATGGTLSIGVRDTGAGIPVDRLDELFVPFSRLDAEESGIEGTGLGLVLSRRLVEAMGGRLRVESEPGVGSTFWVELSLVEDPREAPRPAPPSRRAEPQGERPPKTILYMEDNLANLDLVESILQDRPEIHLIPALQGRIGLQLAREHDPDLILLDLHLPDLHGETVLQELSADPRTHRIPVLVISADATPRQVERLRASGIQQYLTKPIDIEQFLAAVDAGLGAE